MPINSNILDLSKQRRIGILSATCQQRAYTISKRYLYFVGVEPLGDKIKLFRSPFNVIFAFLIIVQKIIVTFGIARQNRTKQICFAKKKNLKIGHNVT